MNYYIDDIKYNRNDYAWNISKFLVTKYPFEYICPYTEQIIYDENTLDYDHIVPLKSTYLRGANTWTNEQKNEYSYNQWVGIDVLNSANRRKSDKGPADWLPDYNVEDYCYSWLSICSFYNLDMTYEEIEICEYYIMEALEVGETVEYLGGYYN